ncbi:FAD-binding oxidoreductase [SAR92 clade bacterium H455]|uniref:FAD-binding oxidoreductase n=1 Tax=SAR92 clade bacterium H455 TaxID=2974818 RepID=A0ABY5TJD9_9GAMM|nr:FAD-binding oxidoreductase [SAR92 clade bacterium H455]
MQEVNSYYAHSAGPQAAFASLLGDQRADICIVGAGYTGLSSALYLAERGYSVIVLEAESVGFGASGRNGGHVGIGQRQDQYYLEKQFGDEVARGLWDMGLEAVDTVEQLIQKHGIHCDLKRGILHLAHRSKYCRELEDEVDHLRDHYQFEQMEYVDAGALPNFLDSQAYYGAQWDKASLHLHPLKYAQGLGKAAAEAGVTICEQSKVLSYSEGDSIVVRTANGSVTASELVLACNGYIEKLEPRINGYIMPINNFILATEPLSNDLAQSVSARDTAMQDTRFVINYWKLSADNRLIFGGGENYRRGFPRDIKAFVRRYMLQIYPQLEGTAIDYGWGGTLAITLNRMPHFGRIGDNIWHLQGYSGHGVPTATLAGKLIAEAISGKLERFDLLSSLPTRKFPGGTLLRWPGMVAGMLYFALRDRI